ncbi:MAG: tetratricopeptide repeat protein [Parcubacteria group bacterium]
MQNKLDRIIKIIINLLVFLVPLFFLPFSYEAFEFNKQYLLFFLVLIALFAWLARMIFLDKEVKFNRTPLDIPILAVVFLAVLSVIFSSDKFSSLFGTYGRFSDGLIPFLVMIIFYFLVTNNDVKIFNLIKLFIYSGSIVILAGYFSVFEIWVKINAILKFLPQIMLQGNFNPVSGPMEGLAIFISIFLALLVGILLTQKSESKIKNLFYWLVLAAGLGLLLIIDFSPAWIVLLVALLAFVAFSLVTRMFKEDVNKLLLPIFLSVMAGVFLLVNLPGNFQNQIPRETVISQGQSWSVAIKTAISGPKNVFLGSGPGTFSLDFSKFKSAELNKTDLWQYRFDRAGSGFAETLATTGFLGSLSNLFLIGLFLMMNWIFLKLKDKNSEAKDQLPMLMFFVALLVGQIVYYQNTATMFMFWLVLALSSANMQKNPGELKYSFKEFPEIGLIFSVVLVVIAVIFLGLSFFAVRFYLADAAYLKAIMSYDEQVQAKNLETAAAYNPYQIQYKIILSRFYLAQALAEVRKPVNAQNFQKAESGIGKAIDLARIITEISENNVAAWENRGLLYRDVDNLVSGAADWGIKSFEKATALEPTNPALHTELGKLLLATKKEDARKEFDKAIELKSDYSDAMIQQALLLEEEGKSEDAINKLEAQVLVNPHDLEVLFQLGRFYYNNKRADEAILVFQRIVTFSPNYSNAHYALGVIFSGRGEDGSALAAFKKVLELNPGNEDVIDKIRALEK